MSITTDNFGPRPGELWQKQLNQAFPSNARHIPDQPRRIPVWVRVVWEVDGEEWCAGSAARWTRTHVLVWFLVEPRSQFGGIWVVPGDVRRRVVPEPDPRGCAARVYRVSDTSHRSSAGKSAV